MDSRFEQYMVWMGYWGQAGVKLEGRNPRRFGNIQGMKLYRGSAIALSRKFSLVLKNSMFSLKRVRIM